MTRPCRAKRRRSVAFLEEFSLRTLELAIIVCAAAVLELERNSAFHAELREKESKHSTDEWFWDALNAPGPRKWQELMRISRPLFRAICERLIPLTGYRSAQTKDNCVRAHTANPVGRPRPVVERVLGVVICHMANGSTASFFGRTLGTSQQTMSRWKRKIYTALGKIKDEAQPSKSILPYRGIIAAVMRCASRQALSRGCMLCNQLAQHRVQCLRRELLCTCTFFSR